MVPYLMQAKRAKITNLILADEGNSWKPEEDVVKDIVEFLNTNNDVLEDDE
ncbi:hypothetical protein LguiB_013491 [Lonicera macranthoides]